MSAKIVFVNRSGELKEIVIKTFDPTTLYKKANTTIGDGFGILDRFIDTQNNNQVLLYGKRASRESGMWKECLANVYKFPSNEPNDIDKNDNDNKIQRIYGHCLLVRTKLNCGDPICMNDLANLTLTDWIQLDATMYHPNIRAINSDQLTATTSHSNTEDLTDPVPSTDPLICEASKPAKTAKKTAKPRTNPRTNPRAKKVQNTSRNLLVRNINSERELTLDEYL